MRNGIGVTDINGAVRKDGAEERADYALGLVRTSDVAIADVKDDERMNLGRQIRRRRRDELQNGAIAGRHLVSPIF